jgi:hypothetical protein
VSAPAFGTLGTLFGSSTASPAFAVPASVAANDIIVVYAFLDSTVTVSAMPSGFAHAAGSPRTVASGGGFGQHSLVAMWKRATAGDTGTYGFTLSGSTFVYGNAVRYTGAITTGDPWDTTATGDGGAVNLTTAPAVSLTTLGADRLLCYGATNFNGDGGTWTAPTGFAQRQGGVNTTNCEISDLVQTSAAGTGSLSATQTASGFMGAWLGALIGTTGAASSIPPPAARAVPSRDPGEAWWLQRDLRDANTVATAANPLPSPLDVAYGAGGPIWWQRGGAVDAALRTWAPQQRTSDSPTLLDPTPPGAAPPPPRPPAPAAPPPAPARTVQTRDYGDAQWLQAPRRDPLLLTTAQLENELLGGDGTGPRASAPATNAPHWWMPQQPARQAFTPGLLDTAELEGPLLAGDLRRHGHAAVYTDRRAVPQQRQYVSDPSFYPALATSDPLALAYGAGGHYWLLYNQAALAMDRREVPQQRAYVSDPQLLATALLEGPLLGGGDTARHLTWLVDRREAPQQRIYTDPAELASALLEGVLLGGGDTGRHATWFADRRLAPQQPARYVPQVALVPADPLLLAGATGGDRWRRLLLAATHADRRQAGLQPPRWTIYVTDHQCVTPRPSTGTTARGSGITARLDTGITEAPC